MTQTKAARPSELDKIREGDSFYQNDKRIRLLKAAGSLKKVLKNFQHFFWNFAKIIKEDKSLLIYL